MAKSTRNMGDPELSSNEGEDARHRREFAMKFPPGTPHSVINHWYAVEHETQLATIADPRKLKSERVAGFDMVESAPGEGVPEVPDVLKAPKTPRRTRKSKAPKATTKETAPSETKA